MCIHDFAYSCDASHTIHTIHPQVEAERGYLTGQRVSHRQPKPRVHQPAQPTLTPHNPHISAAKTGGGGGSSGGGGGGKGASSKRYGEMYTKLCTLLLCANKQHSAMAHHHRTHPSPSSPLPTAMLSQPLHVAAPSPAGPRLLLAPAPPGAPWLAPPQAPS